LPRSIAVTIGSASVSSRTSSAWRSSPRPAASSVEGGLALFRRLECRLARGGDVKRDALHRDPAGRLSSRVPVRWLIGPGLLMVGGGLLLMRGLDASSD
jgi:hypothetical protein